MTSEILDRIAQQQALARAKVPELVAFLEAMKVAFPQGEGHLYKRAPEPGVRMDRYGSFATMSGKLFLIGGKK